MPSGKHKSRTYRRKSIKLSGRTVLRYLKRKPKIAHCSSCYKPLHGVARGRPYQLKKLSKTERRPERPYAGMLCSRCTRTKIKSQLY